MSPPFDLTVADLSGTENAIETYEDLAVALTERDWAIRAARRRKMSAHYRVTDADDAERGDAEWCEECGRRGAFTGRDYASLCDRCRESAPPAALADTDAHSGVDDRHDRLERYGQEHDEVELLRREEGR